MAYVIVKWSRNITEDGRDHYVNKDKVTEDMLYKFRLLDDDNIVYAYGFSTSNSSFRPLDEVGEAYGCTGIQYKNPETEKYEFL